MSLDYKCAIYLETFFNNEKFLKILKRGKGIGCIYFYRESYDDDLDISNDMSAEEALDSFIMSRTTRKNDYNFPKSLAVQHKDTVFTLDLLEGGGMDLYFFILENPWKKKCDSKEYVDFGRYVKLWIDMCEDFCIHKIETSID